MAGAKQPAPKADMAQAIEAFATVETPPTETLDRSTLEAWANCPAQAHAIETGAVSVVGQLAVSGELAHQAFSAATLAWVESGMQLSVRELVAEIENAALASRPDMQPDVIAATRWMAYEWAAHLNRWNANNIVGFDGGEVCGKSGQLSAAFGGVVVTSELDFLGASATEGYDDDFKTGWKEHTAETIAGSFQFQMHAALAFANFPDMETLWVRVWNTRRNSRTPYVPFQRRDKLKYDARLFEAIAVRQRGEIETWPTLEKCAICPLAPRCPAADEVVRETPEARLEQLISVEATAAQIRKLLTAHVDEFGELVLPSGDAFGREKPKSKRKAPADLYWTEPEPKAD